MGADLLQTLNRGVDLSYNGFHLAEYIGKRYLFEKHFGQNQADSINSDKIEYNMSALFCQ